MLTSALLHELADVFARDADQAESRDQVELANHLDRERARIRRRAQKTERAELRLLARTMTSDFGRLERVALEKGPNP